MAKLSVDRALLKAKFHTNKGEFKEAQKLYQAVLQAFPNNKRAQKALAALNKPKQSTTMQGPPQEVINQLINLYSQGQLVAAVEQAQSLTKQYPNALIIWNILGAAHKGLGKTLEASEAFKKVTDLNPHYADGHSNLGATLKDQGKLEEALASFNKALAIKPDYAEAYYNMGVTLKEQGKFDEAIGAYKKALLLKPDYADAYNNLGVVLKNQGKLDEAIASYNKALAIKPNYTDAYNNMGVALQDQSKLKEAIEAYNKAISIKPDFVEVYNNIGSALRDQGRLEEAKKTYNKALAIQPDNAEAHHNLSFALLTAKDFDQGFIQSEWRWKTKERDGTFLQSAKPMWNGEKNQRVLVWGEQGIGDELMFSSIIPELYATSLKILVRCDKRLIPLFERSFPVDVIYFSKDQPIPEDEYDFHIPMGSLPLTFRKSLDSFRKSASGFLKCDMSRVKSIKAQLMQKYDRKILGISWRTASLIRGSSNRNINLAELAKALDSSNTQLLCLQYGDVSDEIEAVKRDLGIEVIQFSDVDNKNDIDGLAALMAACDTVVTIDNATTHLSGALGLPTKLMLPLTADWRWGISENSSYWYDSVQLYKQSEVNVWHSVLAQI
jgi:tetratricopeptide (TPR) repeat protein